MPAQLQFCADDLLLGLAEISPAFRQHGSLGPIRHSSVAVVPAGDARIVYCRWLERVFTLFLERFWGKRQMSWE